MVYTDGPDKGGATMYGGAPSSFVARDIGPTEEHGIQDITELEAFVERVFGPSLEGLSGDNMFEFGLLGYWKFDRDGEGKELLRENLTEEGILRELFAHQFDLKEDGEPDTQRFSRRSKLAMEFINRSLMPQFNDSSETSEDMSSIADNPYLTEAFGFVSFAISGMQERAVGNPSIAQEMTRYITNLAKLSLQILEKLSWDIPMNEQAITSLDKIVFDAFDDLADDQRTELDKVLFDAGNVPSRHPVFSLSRSELGVGEERRDFLRQELEKYVSRWGERVESALRENPTIDHEYFAYLIKMPIPSLDSELDEMIGRLEEDLSAYGRGRLLKRIFHHIVEKVKEVRKQEPGEEQVQELNMKYIQDVEKLVGKMIVNDQDQGFLVTRILPMLHTNGLFPASVSGLKGDALNGFIWMSMGVPAIRLPERFSLWENIISWFNDLKVYEKPLVGFADSLIEAFGEFRSTQKNAPQIYEYGTYKEYVQEINSAASDFLLNILGDAGPLGLEQEYKYDEEKTEKVLGIFEAVYFDALTTGEKDAERKNHLVHRFFESTLIDLSNDRWQALAGRVLESMENDVEGVVQGAEDSSSVESFVTAVGAVMNRCSVIDLPADKIETLVGKAVEILETTLTPEVKLLKSVSNANLIASQCLEQGIVNDTRHALEVAARILFGDNGLKEIGALYRDFIGSYEDKLLEAVRIMEYLEDLNVYERIQKEKGIDSEILDMKKQIENRVKESKRLAPSLSTDDARNRVVQDMIDRHCRQDRSNTEHLSVRELGAMENRLRRTYSPNIMSSPYNEEDAAGQPPIRKILDILTEGRFLGSYKLRDSSEIVKVLWADEQSGYVQGLGALVRNIDRLRSDFADVTGYSDSVAAEYAKLLRDFEAKLGVGYQYLRRYRRYAQLDDWIEGQAA